ncbi:phage tail spike protein [Lactococcus petauri]|uniref:phage tail spike protein n=1 Tax=Lactococcus petauri TaxID=1940789 RepID=UPI003853C236
MITLYNKTESNFNHNGLAVLDGNILNPVVSEELNGLFSFEFDYPIHAPHSEELLPEMIVKAPVPELSDQLFRIVERDDALGGFLHIVAHHIFYDLATNFIEDTYIVNKNGSGALTQLLGATQFMHRFTGTSNISAVNNVRLVRLNPVEVLLDSDLENGFQSSYGGEIVRDNFTISMLTTRGSNNGVQIRDKKNLTGYKADVDYSGIVTRIMPQGYDGLFLPEKYVDSPNINQYVQPKIKVIKYDNVKVGDEEDEFTQAEAYDELRRLAGLEYSANKVDLPKATYDVEFAPLERTEEYKDFAQLETINLGDTVSVIHAEDGLNITARMVSYKYDPFLKAYISVTLGNITPKFTDVAKDINRVDNKAEQAKDDANYALSSANGKNTNFYGPTTPNNPKLGDVWYKENGDKFEMWVYEIRDGVTQWYPLMTDMTAEEVKQAVEQAQKDANTATEKANQAFNDAVNALNAAESVGASVETLTTSVEQNTSKISLVASGMSTLEGRVITAESTLTVQAGQIASKASQSTVDNLTGRITTAESTITQNADRFELSLSKTNKAVNVLAGMSIADLQWAVGGLNTNDGKENTYGGYVRSGFTRVRNGEKYLLQTFVGEKLYSTYATAYLLYYKEDKSFLSYTQFGNTTTPLTVPSSAAFIRIRLTTSDAPETISCYMLKTDVTNGYVDLSEISNVVKLTATTDALLLSVSETKEAIGVPFKVNQWEQGSLSTTDGSEVSATNYIRSEFLDVKVGDKYIGQLRDGTQATFYYHYYGMDLPYIDFVPTAKQFSETLTAGTYTNATIASYLVSKNVESMSITSGVTTNPYSNSGDYLVIYKLPLEGKVAPSVISWNGRKDTSDNIVLLYTGGAWEQISTVTSSSNATYSWTLTAEQISGITTDSVYLAFFSVKTGTYAGIYNSSNTPFTLNPSDGSSYHQISYTGSSGAITVPSGTLKMRVRVNTSIKPDEYEGNIYPTTTRQDYTNANTLYSAILMQKDLINLRVGKGDVINQINISPESILIAGNKVHITGQTTIDSAVISSAMIQNAAITNAKIADATIQSAKIASIDAAKITTGTLSAARIGANSITADKIAANILTALTASSSIRITGTTIGYYSGSTLVTEINSQGMTIRRGGTTVGTIGANNISGHSDWRGLVFDLEYGTEYMSWAHKDSSSASVYTQKLSWYARTLQSGMEKGFHFDDDIYLPSMLRIGTQHQISVGGITFSSSLYTKIGSSSGSAGIAFNGSNLMLGDDGKWVDFGVIREICAKLAGRTIALPTGFSSNGTASGWYNPQSFNSMTTYS